MKMKCSREGTCFFSSSAKSMYWSWRKSTLAPASLRTPISSGRASLKLRGTNVKPEAGMEMKSSAYSKLFWLSAATRSNRGEAEAVKGVADTPCFLSQLAEGASLARFVLLHGGPVGEQRFVPFHELPHRLEGFSVVLLCVHAVSSFLCCRRPACKDPEPIVFSAIVPDTSRPEALTESSRGLMLSRCRRVSRCVQDARRDDHPLDLGCPLVNLRYS